MLFNTLAFLTFLPIVFVVYWLLARKKLNYQNTWLLATSYVFYGWWDYRFLGLIIATTMVDFIVGIQLQKHKTKRVRKQLLWVSIVFNLCVLGFFKYYNFFIESWASLLGSVGYGFSNTWTLKVILPIGISFYTFQTMSYTIDVYRKKIKPTKDLIAFAGFVAFFPQLVAGPIERATNLLPQILKKRRFNSNQATQGLRLILWGMFKKVVVADNLAPMVDDIFANYTEFNGGMLWLGAIYFSFQIYCDFSGYSDIAIGTAKLFGVELHSNFKFPYLSRNIGEFWRRWHVSLSTWFRDYLYIPMGGSRSSRWKSVGNIMVLFLVSGLWHGAKATFVAWGFFHAIIYTVSFLAQTNRKYVGSIVGQDKFLPSFKEAAQITATFLLITIGLVIFRSESVWDAGYYIQGLFGNIRIPQQMRVGILAVGVVYVIEYFFRHDERTVLLAKSKTTRRFLYVILLTAILFSFFKTQQTEFIYFQF